MEDDDIWKMLRSQCSVLNRYPAVKHLAHKDQFSNLMNLGMKLSSEEDDFDFIPRSFLFPKQKQAFIDYSSKLKNKTFIAKACAGSMGDNIYVFKDLKNLNTTTLGDEMVVQRYIDDPLLVDGLKFDLRLYVVVTGMKEGNMHAFLADEGLARFCT